MRRLATLIIAAAWIVLAAPAVNAQNVAKVTYLIGSLYVQTPKGDVRRVTLGAEVGVGDQISTDAGSFARLAFPDGAEFIMRENSRVLVESYVFVEQQPEKDTLSMRLLKGGLRAVTGLVGKRGRASAYQLGSVVATIGIRGTIFDALLCAQDCTGGSDGLYTKAVEDPHTVTNETGTTEVPQGGASYTRDERTPPVTLDLPTGLTLPDDFARGRGRPVRPECF